MNLGGKVIQLRYLIAVVLSIVFAIFYLVAGSWGELLTVSTDILFVLVSAACAILSFLVLKKWGARGKLGATHLGLFLAIFLWFLGEASWTIFEVVMNTPIPYPSFADVFYLAGYLPLVAGTFRLVWGFKDQINRQRVLISTFLGIIVVGITGVFLFGPLLTESTNLLALIFDFAYPILDVIVLLMCLFLVLNNPFGKSVMGESWFWISIGIGLYTAAGHPL